ncbi:PEP-CTERM sorting domain-containing protein [Duganella aceris]|uniref:PEP-CTERM sorting domain-containing protein n=1 Tax=Duganella aceris TaxID=2703883 RepID=UPI001E59E86B|nr:PEP-CTERM sorting domain-containing protein [Duganella aceris]
MKTTLNLLKTAAAAATLLTAVGAQATTIDFDAASVSQLNHINWLGSSFGSSYTEDGFTLQSSGPFPVNSLVVADITYNAGSYAMAATSLATTTLTAGSAFSIGSIDLLRAPSFSNWTVTFTGTKADSSTVMQSFTLNTANWKTFTFGSSFTNLTSLSWNEGLVRIYAFDNINVTAVPEPETYAMLLGGLGLVGFAARRRKSA